MEKTTRTMRERTTKKGKEKKKSRNRMWGKEAEINRKCSKNNNKKKDKEKKRREKEVNTHK